MRAIEIENVRCFKASGNIQLAPLTILVGENSTGKSTFLASLRLAWDASFSDKPLDFNEEPFLMGAYDQIAHYRGGKGGRADKLRFALTAGVPDTSSTSALTMSATLTRQRAQPVITEQTLTLDDTRLLATTTSNGRMLRLTVGDYSESFNLEDAYWRSVLRESRVVAWNDVLWRFSQPGSVKDRPDVKGKLEAIWGAFVTSARVFERRPVALAPVRTKPLRTYDPVSETPDAEGSHIPILMEQAYFREQETWDSTKAFLEGFGRASGLFNKIQIRPLGKSESDPFQVRVSIAGPPTAGPAINLIDVGYGVSQILPLVGSVMLKPVSRVFLFQQPEVHLHPRAQAELSTLFRYLVEQGTKPQLIVETHSDHLLDRVRTDVRDGHWKPEQIAILFFERKRLDVKVHQIRIDKEGNLEGAPPSYRKFFLEEEQRILGI